MQWFRLYSEFSTDAKVQMMPECMQRRLVMIFCLHAGNGLVTLQKNNVTLHETELAFSLRISEEELQKTKKLFLEKNFINDDWTPKNWEERQKPSDSSTARVRRYREAKKKNNVTLQKNNVTLHVTGCNGLEEKRIEEKKKEKDISDDISQKKKSKVENFAFPLWLPLQDWQDFLEMRKQIKSTPTARANELLIKKLEELKESGNDPGEVLRQSTMNNWKGIFEIRENNYGTTKKTSVHDDITAGIALGIKERSGQSYD